MSASGQPSNHSTKHARWLAAITTTRAACFSPGSATTRAGSHLTSSVSTNGMPCRMSSRTVPTHLFSSQTCELRGDNMKTQTLCKCTVHTDNGISGVFGLVISRQWIVFHFHFVCMGLIAVWHKIPVKNAEDIHSSEIYKTKWNSTCYKSLKSHKIVNSFCRPTTSPNKFILKKNWHESIRQTFILLCSPDQKWCRCSQTLSFAFLINFLHFRPCTLNNGNTQDTHVHQK